MLSVVGGTPGKFLKVKPEVAGFAFQGAKHLEARKNDLGSDTIAGNHCDRMLAHFCSCTCGIVAAQTRCDAYLTTVNASGKILYRAWSGFSLSGSKRIWRIGQSFRRRGIARASASHGVC